MIAPLPLTSDDVPGDFHMRLSRRGCARPIADRRRPRQPMRSLSALAIAIAVPAFAAPQGWNQGATAPADPPAAFGFERKGESFPGSAFYYLDDAPIAPPSPQQAASQARWDSDSDFVPPPPAARPLVARVSPADHARALECMTMAIYYEAASESTAGQRAVAQVVLNRVAHPSYPATVCGVVFQGSARTTGCQFTFTCDGSLARKPERNAWARARSVARAALDGHVYAPVGLATHYHTIQIHPYWADSLSRIGTIGAHIFYRWKGAAGQPSAFRTTYAGGEPALSTLAADRARSAELADPVALARAFEQELAAHQATYSQAMPHTGNAAEAAPHGADMRFAGEKLPASGTIKAEYAASGRWLVPQH